MSLQDEIENRRRAIKTDSYEMELVVRFLTLRTLEQDQLRGLVDVNTFLTDRILHLSNAGIDIDAEVKAFKESGTGLSERDQSHRNLDDRHRRRSTNNLFDLREYDGRAGVPMSTPM